MNKFINVFFIITDTNIKERQNINVIIKMIWPRSINDKLLRRTHLKYEQYGIFIVYSIVFQRD